MSHLISRILLAILLFPLAALVYLVVFVLVELSWGNSYSGSWRIRQLYGFSFAGIVAWGFIALYWWLLWRGSVRFTSPRTMTTLLAFVASAGIGVFTALVLDLLERGVGDFVGSCTAPLLWVVATCFLWRETREERAARLGAGRATIVCPACGYNLTGLAGTRCPEWGKQYTLDELLASQPSNAGAELAQSP